MNYCPLATVNIYIPKNSSNKTGHVFLKPFGICNFMIQHILLHKRIKNKLVDSAFFKIKSTIKNGTLTGSSGFSHVTDMIMTAMGICGHKY